MANELIPPAPDDVESLKRENAELRLKLERSNELHRLNNEWLLSNRPYEPMTEDEIHDMMHAPRGESILEVVEQFEQGIFVGE